MLLGASVDVLFARLKLDDEGHGLDLGLGLRFGFGFHFGFGFGRGFAFGIGFGLGLTVSGMRRAAKVSGLDVAESYETVW